MFENCYNLTSIELSSFNTEEVCIIDNMFYDCRSLKSLNLSNFKTHKITDLDNIFYNCYSLEYLDISNFNTENTYNYRNMFFNTSSLISLNLTNFIIRENSNIENMILNMNPNITLCYNKSKMPSEFISQVSEHENKCKEMCDMESKIFIPEIEKCVDACYYSGSDYKYEYQYKCYTECPKRTKFYNDTKLCEDCRDYYDYNQTGCLDSIPDEYYNNDTTNNTIDKCPIECKTCSYESVYNGLCVSCNINDGYYPKLDDLNNNNSFYKCYQEEPIGYFLDIINNIFKPCYTKCKTCSGEGNDENNNCLQCIDDSLYTFDNGKCIINQLVQNISYFFLILKKNNFI